MPTKTGKQENDAQHIEIGKKTAGVATSIITGRFLALILSGIAFIIVARILGPSTYGIFTIAIAFATFFGAFGDIGVGTAFSKLVGQYIVKNDKESIRKVLSNGYAIMLITGTIFTIIAILSSGLIAHYALGSSSHTFIVQVASLIIILSIMYSASYYATIGFGNGKYIAIVILMQSVLQSIFSIILVYMKFGAMGPIIGTIIGYSVGLVFSLFIIVYKFKIRFPMPSFKGMKDLLGFSAPISIYTGLRGVVNNLSPILLGLFATTIIVGNYGVALRTANLFLLVTDSITFALLPMFASTLSIESLGKSLNKIYNYAIYMTFVIMVPAMFYIAVLAKQFSYTVFSASYMLTPIYISVISIGILFWAVATYTTMLLIGRNLVKDVLKYAIMIAIMEFALMSILIPLFKGYGLVVLLYIISPVVMSSLSVMIASKKLSVMLNTSKLARVIAAGIISALLILPIAYLSSDYILVLVLGLIEQLLVYPPLLAIIGGADKEDLDTIKRLSHGLPIINFALETLSDYSAYFVR
ncbi:MAG: oligosaccharide flippase family protein [Candidatus Micrarchaeaceae archaeon]